MELSLSAVLLTILVQGVFWIGLDTVERAFSLLSHD